LDLLSPSSVLDVGCGTGAWLKVFDEHGIKGVGVDNSKSAGELCPAGSYKNIDLTGYFSLGSFDLVLCLEVAEHLDARWAGHLIDLLTRHGDLVLFSAAVPGQGGSGHVNEQWPEYWALLFYERGYVGLGIVRDLVWECSGVAPCLRNNLLLFVKRDRLKEYPLFQEYHRLHRLDRLSVVHPVLFEHIASGRGVLLKDFLYKKIILEVKSLGQFHH